MHTTTDLIAERHEPPTREAIEESRTRQLAAIRDLRRRILEGIRIADIASTAA